MTAYIILVIGFVLLIKGADFFVDGAASIAQKLRVPGFIIGMTVVAMGTSAPECAVSITASIRGSNGMAISNVIGSNVFNLLVVCGMCALFSPLVIKKSTLKKEFPFSILAAVILLVLGAIGMSVNRVEGVILLLVFVFFLSWMVLSATKAMGAGQEIESGEMKELSNLRCVLYVIGGMAAIVAGGQMVVNSAEVIALRFGMSETLVGLTICSIGTSLPELVTSIVAARKNQADMALGNVIGSNIFNILLVGGLATAISPIAVTQSNLTDLGFLIAVSAYMLLLVWKRQELRRGGGISMLVIYGAYMIYICLRDTGFFFF
ncbi:MAG: calcium/sodium antiporter [Clostridiales bacterium]|nr:calcium/sodium antiporter [Clostridiales bacterium]MCD8110476.1 calcium/sodium antiporter [Clostridiales bacterium]MCD8132713.1 calcium/sodium antiporter [Clostridiales bacterium]